MDTSIYFLLILHMTWKKRSRPEEDEEVPLDMGSMKPPEQCECFTDPDYYQKVLARAKANPLIIF